MPYARRSGADPLAELLPPHEPLELEVGDGESDMDWCGFSGISTLLHYNIKRGIANYQIICICIIIIVSVKISPPETSPTRT